MTNGRPSLNACAVRCWFFLWYSPIFEPSKTYLPVVSKKSSVEYTTPFPA